MLTDREEALIEALFEKEPLCPYHLKQILGPTGLEGAHGPDTCAGGCVDEPSCITDGPFGLAYHPDLAQAIVDRWKDTLDA